MQRSELEEIDPKDDLVFQALFGKENNTASLISLLNGLLALRGSQRIQRLRHLRPSNEVDALEDKSFVMDVFVEDEAGNKYGVEMQLQNHAAFRERTLYYACRRYGEQLAGSEAYTRLRPLVLLVLANFMLFPAQDQQWKERFELRGLEHGQVYSKQLSIVLVELPKFRKPILEVREEGEKWICFLKEGLKMQAKLKDDQGWMTPEIQKAMEELEKLKGDERFRALYEAKKRELQVHMTLLEQRFNEGLEAGLEKGIEKGIEKGEHSAALKFALRLLGQGEALERVAELTDLSLEELRSLHRERN